MLNVKYINILLIYFYFFKTFEQYSHFSWALREAIGCLAYLIAIQERRAQFKLIDYNLLSP